MCKKLLYTYKNIHLFIVLVVIEGCMSAYEAGSCDLYRNDFVINILH